MKLPILLSKNQRRSLLIGGLKTFLSILGGAWLLIEMSAFFIPDAMQWASGNFWVLIVCASGALVFTTIDVRRKSKRMLSVRERLEGTDISIIIQVGNIFNMKGDIIIGTNTTFDTDMSDGMISEDSLQGQFTKKYYDKVDHLHQELVGTLQDEKYTLVENKSGNTKRYDFGTVVKVSPKNQVVYLVAIDELNEEGVVSSLENVRQSLTKLWQYIGTHGRLSNLVIPIIGTKDARIQVPREIMLVEIIESFIRAIYTERKFCENLTIVIAKEDYEHIDLQELGNYLHVHAIQKRWQKEPVGQSIPAEQENKQ